MEWVLGDSVAICLGPRDVLGVFVLAFGSGLFGSPNYNKHRRIGKSSSLSHKSTSIQLSQASLHTHTHKIHIHMFGTCIALVSLSVL